MKATTIAVAALLAGCTTSSQVVPIGKDSYMVTAATSAFSGMNKSPHIKAAQRANQYCDALAKHMIIRRMDTTGRVGFGNVSVNYLFSCVGENDPEYQRPDLRKEPTTVMEDARH